MRPHLLSLLVLAACAEEAAPGASGPPPALVRVAPVESGELTEAWMATADVRALDRAGLASGAAGAVSRVLVREGDRVHRGDLLVEVQLDLASAQLAAARASVAEAEAELARRELALSRRKSVKEGVLAAEELTEAETALSAQKARLEAARAAEQEATAVLGRHRVRAPFAGVVAGRHVDAGDWVGVGTPVIDLIGIDSVEARTHVPLELATRLEAGQPVEVNGGSGELVAIVPTLDETTRTALVRIAPDPELGLVPGQVVDVGLPVTWAGLGVKVPRDAVLLDPQQDRVLKVSEGSALSVPVEILARGEAAVLVRGEGLAVGDSVVTRGNERVRPGQPLRIEGSE